MKQQWKFGALGTASGSPATFTFTQSGSVSTTLEVTAQSGCVYPVTKNVTIEIAPTALFTPTPEAGVPPLEVSFQNNSLNATSYLWAFNDSDNTTTSDVSPSFIFLEEGGHVVDLTAFNDLGCSSTISKIIKAMQPQYDISLIGFNIIKNDDGSLKMIASLKNEGNVSLTNLSLELSISGNTAVRENIGETVGPKASVNHTLNYEILDGSKLDFLCAKVILNDDPSPENNERCITIDKPFYWSDPYPNPASGELNISWIAGREEPLFLTIIDALGKQVMSATRPSAIGMNSLKILTDVLGDGVYIIIVKYSTFKDLKKVAIQH